MNTLLTRRFAYIPAALVLLLASCGGSTARTATATSQPNRPSQPSASALATAQQRALVIAGGGPLGRAWEIGLLKGLKDAGIDLTQADLVIGTSIGGILGAQIRAGKSLDALYASSTAPASAPAPASGPPAYDAAYAQQAVQPVASLISAAELTQAARIEVGKRALAAPSAISEEAQVKAAAASLGDIREWPQSLLRLPTVDAANGSVRLLDRTQGVPLDVAVAATTANPASGKTPITIDDRRYMEGTVGGSHVDAAAGYAAIVALTPPNLLKPEIARQQVEAMRSQGEKILALEPDADSLAAMGPDRFDLSRSRATAEAGFHQAASVAPQVRSLWLGGTVAAPAAAAAGPATLALRFNEAINRGDPAGAAALFADDAVFIGGAPCGFATPCKTHDGILKRTQTLVANHNTQTPIGSPIVAGNLVHFRWEGRNDVTKAAGVDRAISIATAGVQGDKIVSWIAWNDLSDQQSAKNQLFQQSSASASSANNTDPAVVAKRWSEIVNKGDVNAVNDVFTPDVVFIGGPPCAVRTPCTGVAAMPKRVEDAAAAHQQHQNVTAVAAGNSAQVRWENVSHPQRKAGIDRIVVMAQATIRGDKIATWAIQQDLSDPQTLKWQQIQQAQAASPKPSGT